MALLAWVVLAAFVVLAGAGAALFASFARLERFALGESIVFACFAIFAIFAFLARCFPYFAPSLQNAKSKKCKKSKLNYNLLLSIWYHSEILLKIKE